MGTGLGTALVLPYPNGDSFRYYVNPSEGWASYCTINDLDERHVELGKFMFDTLKTRSNLNRFSKGNGIMALHQFMKQKHPDLENYSVAKSVKKALKE